MAAAPEVSVGTGEPSELVLDDVRKAFQGHLAVDRCSLSLKRGEILALLGASGCGKSTLLNLIAGFETPDFGTITLRGGLLNNVPPYRRNIAMVFQHYAMFPHLTVAQNIVYGLTARRMAKEEMAARLDEMLALLHLTGLQHRYPAQLSGGQRQRVAVARALAVRPDMLLLDEAFSALDRNLREEMQLEMSLLLRRLEVTTILVTHDQREAFALADRIAVMESGRISQIGTPREVYRAPENSYVLRFLGTANRFAGAVTRAGDTATIVAEPGIVFTVAADALERGDYRDAVVDVRAEDIAISANPTAMHHHTPARVSLQTFLGSQERIVAELGPQQVVIERPAFSDAVEVNVGSEIYLSFDPGRCRVSEAARP
ncbi:ABC transporter ATP-binding protein [Acuticoccus kandeliae]|uniref:ABC transporter ATP-binding protein n=1 Tax=Acuticoccus kandeliae TaxID=2073160 RepID=UPI000D3E5014|nr:ABC transporter ATP-binding protein [Acuticoccus kandeliae]